MRRSIRESILGLVSFMSDIAIRVENLAKQYRIGALQRRHDTLRDVIADSRSQIANSLAQMFRSPSTISDSPSADSTIWALKDVSFEVKRGEIVGIIGRNGAGKSTLLKILSRITEPSEGQADLYGRVASLLEVGTGFHGELSGRENIYLSGAIMGMKKAEIDLKFDEIVAFAEVEKFIDTSVKHYSSGMYMRLAFAVAAHLEPEILLVDEVLAVGDIAFQKKCLGKIGDVAREGRTVLFVSHNMAMVRVLCNTCVVLENGSILARDETSLAIERYESLHNSPSRFVIADRKDRTGTGAAHCVGITLLDLDDNELAFIYSGQPFKIRLDFLSSIAKLGETKVGIGIDTLTNERILTLYSGFTGQEFVVSEDAFSFSCLFSTGLPLRPDLYKLTTFLGKEYLNFDVVQDAAVLEVRESNYYPSGRLPSRAQGVMLLKHDWIFIR